VRQNAPKIGEAEKNRLAFNQGVFASTGYETKQPLVRVLPRFHEVQTGKLQS